MMMSNEMSESSDDVCRAQHIIDACKEPLIGLQYVTEFKLRSGVDTSWYVCNLCEVKFTYKLITSHTTSVKHRINYMKERFMNYHTMIYQFAKTNNEKSSLAAEYAGCIEEEEGRHKVKIKISDSAEGNTSAAKKRLLEEHVNHETPQVACPPKRKVVLNDERYKTTSRRIHFVGSGPKSYINSSLQNVGSLTVVPSNNVSKENEQKSLPDPSSQSVNLGPLSSERQENHVNAKEDFLMSLNPLTAVPLQPRFRPPCDPISSTGMMTALPLKPCLSSCRISTPGSTYDMSTHVTFKSCLKSANNALISSSVSAIAEPSLVMNSSSVTFTQNVYRSSEGNGFVHKPCTFSFSTGRKESSVEELLPQPNPISSVPPLHPASILQSAYPPVSLSDVKITAPPMSMHSSPLPIRTLELVQNSRIPEEFPANTMPTSLTLSPSDNITHARKSLSVNAQPLSSKSSTTMMSLVPHFSCTMPTTSINSSCSVNSSRCSIGLDTSGVVPHSNDSILCYSILNSSISHLDSQIKNSMNKIKSCNTDTNNTRPHRSVSVNAGKFSMIGPTGLQPVNTRRDNRTHIVSSKPRSTCINLSTSTLSSLMTNSESRVSSCSIASTSYCNINLALQKASEPLHCQELLEKDFTVVAATTVNHSPAFSCGLDLQLDVARSRIQNNEERKSECYAPQIATASLDKTFTVSGQAKDITHSVQASMTSAISCALAKALVEYQLKKKQKNPT